MLLNCEHTNKAFVQFNEHCSSSPFTPLKSFIDITQKVKELAAKSSINRLLPIHFDINLETFNISVKPKKVINSLDEFKIFTAPEISKNNDTIQEQSLIYSLGIIFQHFLINPIHWPEIEASPYTTCDYIAETSFVLIIKKMISKDPEERYQSLSGVINDFKYVERSLRESGEVSSFIPGKRDKQQSVNLNKYIFGRDSEIMNINNALQSNKTSIIFLNGASGIGKTYLINKILGQHHNQFHLIKVKYDEKTIRSNKINDVLNMIKALGNNQANASISLKLNKIFSDQQSQKKVSKGEQITFISDCLNTISTTKKVVIFLDDAQWMDDDAKYLLLNSIYNSQNCTMILSTRESLSNYASFYKERDDNAINTQFLEISELSESNIEEQISAVFKNSESKSKQIAKKLFSKTHGNPLHINQLLLHFYEEEIVTFDKTHFEWEWNIRKIDEIQVVDSVADLLIDKVDSLPKDAQLILHYGAVIGSQFSSQFISKLLNKDLISVELALWHGIQKELIIENNYKNSNEYTFLHDKIRQACINLEKFDQKKTNLFIGKKLNQNIDESSAITCLEPIINHLNNAVDYLSNPEKEKLLHFNHRYANYQIENMYGKSAENYFSNALLLANNINIPNKTRLDLYLGKINALHLNSRFDEVSDVIKQATSIFKDPKHQQILTLVNLNLLITQSKYKEALQTGETIFRSHNQSLTLFPSLKECQIKIILTLVKLLIGSKKVSIKNSSTKDSFKFLSNVYFLLIGPSFFLDKLTYCHMVCEFMLATIKNGTTKETPFVIFLFSKIILSAFKSFKLINFLITKAFTILEKFDDQKVKIQSNHIYNVFISRYFKPISENIADFKKNIERSKKETDIVFLAYGINSCPIFMLSEGKSLKKAFSFLTKNEKFLYDLKYKDGDYQYEIIKWFDEALSGSDQATFNNKIILKDIFKDDLLMPFSLYLSLQVQAYYFFNEHEKAIALAEKYSHKAKDILGLIQIEELFFYYSLSLMEYHNQTTKRLNRNSRKQINKTIQLFKTFSRQNKANYATRYYCLIGSWEAFKNKQKKALRFFHKMLDEANKNKTPLFQSMAHRKIAKETENHDLKEFHLKESDKYMISWKTNK